MAKFTRNTNLYGSDHRVVPHYSKNLLSEDGTPLLIDNYSVAEKPEKEFDPHFNSSPNELFYEIDQKEADALKAAIGEDLLISRNFNRVGGHNKVSIIATTPSGVDLEYESLDEINAELGIGQGTVMRIIKTGVPSHHLRWRKWKFRIKE